MFVADAIKTITGVECAGFFRGKYSTQAGAFRKIKSYAGGGVAEMMDKIATEYHFCETDSNHTQMGDVALCVVDTHVGDDLEVLGVVISDTKIIFAGREGLVVKNKAVGVKFWQIQ
jgi:hypothetical protein